MYNIIILTVNNFEFEKYLFDSSNQNIFYQMFEDDDLRKIISNTIVRRVVIFCSFFMATKDLFTATVLTIIFGFYPNLILDTIHVSVDQLINNYQTNLILSTLK